MTITYTRWKCRPFAQWATFGSRWYFGNFDLGVQIDSHPRFVHVILCCLVFKIGLSWTRDAIVDYGTDDDEEPSP